MNSTSPALPSSTAGHGRTKEGAHRYAGVLTLMGFGFAAIALLSNPQAEPPLATPSAAVKPAATVPSPPARAMDAETGQASGRAWPWETAGEPQRPATQQDLEELWLAR